MWHEKCHNSTPRLVVGHGIPLAFLLHCSRTAVIVGLVVVVIVVTTAAVVVVVSRIGGSKHGGCSGLGINLTYHFIWATRKRPPNSSTRTTTFRIRLYRLVRFHQHQLSWCWTFAHDVPLMVGLRCFVRAGAWSTPFVGEGGEKKKRLYSRQ